MKIQKFAGLLGLGLGGLWLGTVPGHAADLVLGHDEWGMAWIQRHRAATAAASAAAAAGA